MNDVTYIFDISKEKMKFIEDGLETYNYTKNEYLNPIIYDREQKKFGFYAIIDGKLVGGAYGYVDEYCWTYLDLLFVDEKYRGNDIATELIKRVQAFAEENKCIGIRTETWSFQARGFYEKMGFVLYGELENHPPHVTDYLLKKVLIDDENGFPAPITEVNSQ